MSEVIASCRVTEEAAGMRLDAWCVEAFVGLPTRNAVKKAIKRGEVLVNGKLERSERRVQAGWLIECMADSRPPAKVFETPIEVCFEDEHVAVVYKPAGLRVNGPVWRTLENALPFNLGQTCADDALNVPRVAHRLDQRTQGLVVCGKSAKALVGLGQAFERREVHKRYLAVVVGTPPQEFEVCEAIDGRAAITHVEVLRRESSLQAPGAAVALVQARPTTGRRHQIRRHLAGLGFAIVGDDVYTPPAQTLLRGKGLFLAACGLTLAHPVTGQVLDVQRPCPAKFMAYLDRERRRYRRWTSEGT